MRTVWLVVALLASALPALAAKPPKVQWTKTFAGWGDATGYCVQQTSDGGYIAVGTTSGATDALLLVKLTASGDSQWVRTFNADGGMMGSSVVQTSDGGYIVAGGAGAADRGHWDPCLLRVSASGNELWRSLLANLFSARAYSVVRLGDTGYTVVSQRYYGDSGVILTRTDNMGNLRWSHAYNIFYGFEARDEELSLRRTADGGYIIGARTLLKVDSLGAQAQLKTFGSLTCANSVIQTSDGGYAATGAREPYYSSVYLLKMNASRDSVWADTFMPTECSRGHWVEQTSDGGYVIVGTTRPSYEEGDKATLVRTSSNGAQMWTDTLSGGLSGHCVRQTADGGYIVTGTGDENLFVTKLAPERKH